MSIRRLIEDLTQGRADLDECLALLRPLDRMSRSGVVRETTAETLAALAEKLQVLARRLREPQSQEEAPCRSTGSISRIW